MAKHILRNAVLTVDGTNISDHTSSVTLEDSADQVEFTAFSSGGYREFGQGLKTASITAEVFNDYAAASIDAILAPLYASGGTFAVTVKADAATTSGSNPVWTMSSRLYSYSPISGGVGDANTTSLSFSAAGTLGLVRGTV